MRLNERNEVTEMKTLARQCGIAAVALGSLLAGAAMAQEPAAAPAQGKSEMRMAIQWKRFDYTCEGGAKLTVYLHEQTAKVQYQQHLYVMNQTRSADGNRYSDGKVVWWGKGNGGFLQEDTPNWDGKMIVKDCQLEKPLNANPGTVTGTVSYLQRMALPANAVILVQLVDVTSADAAAKVIAEQKITLGERQVPVPYELKYDPAKLDGKHLYKLSGKILVDGQRLFTRSVDFKSVDSLHGYPTEVNMILKQVAAGEAEKP